MVEDEEGLVADATNYFMQIFESSNLKEIEEALANLSMTITESINEDLTAPVTKWKVKLALFAMHPEKVLGSDRMMTILSRKWDIVKEDLARMVNQFFFDGSMA